MNTELRNAGRIVVMDPGFPRFRSGPGTTYERGTPVSRSASQDQPWPAVSLAQARAMLTLPEWPVAFFAALLTGAIAVPLNAWWTGAELEYALKDSAAKFAFVDAERFERIAEHLPNCPELERLFVSRDEEEIAHPKVTKLEN